MPMKRPARAPLPLVTLGLVGAILAVFAVELAGDGAGLCAVYGFVPAHPSLGTALSSLFVHDAPSWSHIAGNLVVLLLVGSRVEKALGSTRFAALFLAGGLAGAAMHVVVDPNSTTPLVGCSGSLFAVLAVAAALFGPVVLAFIAVLALANILHAFGGPEDAGVSFGAHLRGLFAGFLVVLLGRLRGIGSRRAVAA
jgi:membrane associated rhomboid family serine protease